MPPIDRVVRPAADRRVILLVHGGNNSMFPVVSQRDEDGADVVEIVLRRANDLRVVRHGDQTDGVTYSSGSLNLRLSDRPGVTYSLARILVQVSDRPLGGARRL